MDLDPGTLERGYETTAWMLAAVPADRWAAPSPCTGWTVRAVAEHLVDAMWAFVDIATAGSGAAPAPGGIGDDPAGRYRAVARRCLTTFADPSVRTTTYPFPGGPVPGAVIARISLSESLVHGWDIAEGAGLPYRPDERVVTAVAELADAGVAPPDAFAPPLPVPAGASPLVALLARLGREVR